MSRAILSVVVFNEVLPAAASLKDGRRITAVTVVKRILAGIGLLLGAVVYVWFAAVRALPEVRRRKSALRRRRYGGER
jgi:hypothetical protein